jgi:hypothetical protein
MGFWAWIPILTQRVHFEYLMETMLPDELVSISESDKETIEYILKTNEYNYYKTEDVEDKEHKKYKVIICLKSYKIEHIFVYDSEDKIKVHARCSIYDDGIIEIQLDSSTAPIQDQIQPGVAKRIYIIIRDVYHSHTHHGLYDDAKLIPVLCDSKKEAVDKILTQYEKKIITYHKAINIDVKDHNDFTEAIKLITSAKGEMHYGLNFITLLKNIVDNFEMFSFIFSNSNQSISILANEIELKFNNYISRFITGMTFVIIIVTLPITFDAVIRLSETFGFEEVFAINMKIGEMELLFNLTYYITIFYIVFLIILVFKLKFWLIGEMKIVYSELSRLSNKLLSHFP